MKRDLVNADHLVRPCADAAALAYRDEVEGKSASLHGGAAVRYRQARLDEARSRIAACIRARPEEIVFTNGAVDGNARVIRRFVRDAGFVSTDLEPPAIRSMLDQIVVLGPGGRYAFPDERGVVSTEAFFDLMNSSGSAFGVASLASWQTGVIQNIRLEVKGTHLMRNVFHMDASLALGRMPVSARDYNSDFMVGDSALFGGPPGVGFICMRNRVRKNFSRIAAEIDVPPADDMLGGIAGMALALERRQQTLVKNGRYLEELVSLFKDCLLARRNIGTVRFAGERATVLPGFVLAMFPTVESRVVCEALEKKGIFASPVTLVQANGHAVPMIRKMGLSVDYAKGAVRFCFGPENTVEDIRRIAKAIPAR